MGDYPQTTMVLLQSVPWGYSRQFIQGQSYFPQKSGLIGSSVAAANWGNLIELAWMKVLELV